jgi:hypothetical protein
MQCTAKSKSTGKQCARDAIAGGNVCRVHGGAAPQVKRSAQERLLALVDPALAVLSKALRDTKQPKIAFDAARDVLDRAGYRQTERLEVTGEMSIAAILRARRLKRDGAVSAAQKLLPAAPDAGEVPEGADPERDSDD